MPYATKLINEFISSQLCSFEKIPLQIPFEKLPKLSEKPTEHKAVQASIRELLRDIS